MATLESLEDEACHIFLSGYLAQVHIRSEFIDGSRFYWLPGGDPETAVVASSTQSIRLYAKLQASGENRGLRIDSILDDWEVHCEGAADPVFGSRSQWDLRLQIGHNNAVFRLRQSGSDIPGEVEAGDVSVRIVRPPSPGAVPVLSGFQTGGVPYGTLVCLPPAGDDADVHWTLELPAHGDGLQMLLPVLAGGEQALPPGWALRVTCLDGDIANSVPSVHRHEGVHELQLPDAALGPGRRCVAKMVLANGELPHGVTHIISIQRATLILVRHLPLHPFYPAVSCKCTV